MRVRVSVRVRVRLGVRFRVGVRVSHSEPIRIVLQPSDIPKELNSPIL